MFLTLNVGSSSIKYAVFAENSAPCLQPSELTQGLGGNIACDGTASMRGGLERLRRQIGEQMPNLTPAAIIHRFVHGGTLFSEPMRVSDAHMEQLTRLIPLAPLHLPSEIEALRICQTVFPEVPQIVCFDTAFHASQPPLTRQYGLPQALTEQGIIRYGFHGLSYEFIARSLPEVLREEERQRVVVAHLGNGASMCALRDGQSIATTTGFSTLDGLMMGSRCGHLDPGVLLYLGQQQQWSWSQLEQLLYQDSGLLGVSGLSHDVRCLLASDQDQAKAALALFCYTAAREAGSLIMALGGLDALIFTGGIGEYSPDIRADIAAYFQWLGVKMNPSLNRSTTGAFHDVSSATAIHETASRVKVWVMPTDEERMLAWHGLQVLKSRSLANSP